MFRKILKFRLKPVIGIFILLLVFFISGLMIYAKAAGVRVFAGEVVSVMYGCEEALTCSARCFRCGCGPWRQVQISPSFGRVAESSDFVCPANTLKASGSGNFLIGSVIFGYNTTDWPMLNNTPQTQIWSVFQ